LLLHARSLFHEFANAGHKIFLEINNKETKKQSFLCRVPWLLRCSTNHVRAIAMVLENLALEMLQNT
jgi:hypothetical protein